MPLRAVLQQASHHLVIRRRLPPPFMAARIYTSSEGGLRYFEAAHGQGPPGTLSLAAETVLSGALEVATGIITHQAIRRGTFCNVKDLTAATGRFIDACNDRCQTFTWTKDADDLIAKIRPSKDY